MKSKEYLSIKKMIEYIDKALRYTKNCNFEDFFVNEEKIVKEKNLEFAISQIKDKMGLNSIIRGMDLEEGATTLIRNNLVGGHNAI